MDTDDQGPAFRRIVAHGEDLISDITRAVKSGDKAIALNEVSDLALRLNFLADAIAGVPVPAPAPAVSPARVLDPA